MQIFILLCFGTYAVEPNITLNSFFDKAPPVLVMVKIWCSFSGTSTLCVATSINNKDSAFSELK